MRSASIVFSKSGPFHLTHVLPHTSEMTPEEARRIDPQLQGLSDEELAEAIRLLEQLAELALEDFRQKHAAHADKEKQD